MKNIQIRTIGQAQETWQREAVHMYSTRLTPYARLLITEYEEGHGKSAKPDPGKTKALEAERLLRGIPIGAITIALDEHGALSSSEDFTKKLMAWSDGGKPLIFFIGGSWGLDASVIKQADQVISLGRLTLPHALARIILLEQLYRAIMIEQGKTYHK